VGAPIPERYQVSEYLEKKKGEPLLINSETPVYFHSGTQNKEKKPGEGRNSGRVEIRTILIFYRSEEGELK